MNGIKKSMESIRWGKQKERGQNPLSTVFPVHLDLCPSFLSWCSKYNLNIKEVIFQGLDKKNLYFFPLSDKYCSHKFVVVMKRKVKPALLWFKFITIQLKSNLDFQMGSLLFRHATLGKIIWYFITSTVSSGTMSYFLWFLCWNWNCAAMTLLCSLRGMHPLADLLFTCMYPSCFVADVHSPAHMVFSQLKNSKADVHSLCRCMLEG